MDTRPVEIRGILRDARQQINMRPRFIHFHRERKHFISRVYVLATVFILISVSEWIIILLNEDYLDYIRQVYYLTFLAAFSTLMLLTIFASFYEIRYNPPFNWITAFAIVQLATIGLMHVLLFLNIQTLVLGFLLTTILLVGFSLLGNVIPRDLTLDVVILLAISIIFYAGTVVLVIMVIIADIYFPSLALGVILLILMVVYVMYTSQLISGTRAGIFRWNDHIMASLMVYFDFIVISCTIVFLWGVMSETDDDRQRFFD